eukprot:134070-Ditylum_brightwellii.AAC.1
MEGMLNDLVSGSQLRSEFNLWLEQLDVKLHLMSMSMDVFKEWYVKKHQHHHLTWVHSLGNTTVKTTYGKKSHEVD